MYGTWTSFTCRRNQPTIIRVCICTSSISNSCPQPAGTSGHTAKYAWSALARAYVGSTWAYSQPWSNDHQVPGAKRQRDYRYLVMLIIRNSSKEQLEERRMTCTCSGDMWLQYLYGTLCPVDLSVSVRKRRYFRYEANRSLFWI